VQVPVQIDLGCDPATTFAEVGDLAAYPSWLELVTRADAAGPDAWRVVLSARVGPFRRSKTLRMVRTVHVPPQGDEPGRVRFERAEQDGRQHAAWVLDCEVEAVPGGSRLTMALRYDGGLFGPVLEPVLADQIDRGRSNLLRRHGTP
jgi:hypothetical protein